MKEDKQKIIKIVAYLVIIIFLLFVSIDSSRIIYYQVKLNEYTKEGVDKYNHNSFELRQYVNNKMYGIDVTTTKEKKFTEYKFVYHVKLKTPIINLILKDGFKITNKEVIDV